MMTCDEMLELVRAERPNENIKSVISFRELGEGTGDYWVNIDTGLMYYEKIIYPKLRPGTNVLNLPHYD